MDIGDDCANASDRVYRRDRDGNGAGSYSKAFFCLSRASGGSENSQDSLKILSLL